MLELDIGVTKDDKVIVMHDTTVDRVTNGKGTIRSLTLAQIRKLDGAYWFSKTEGHYSHDKPASAYVFRGVATGKRKPPKGYTANDFRVPTLTEVMDAFPRTPINVEVKGRDRGEAPEQYIANARVLAKLLKSTKRRDLIVVSFNQEAVDEFHRLAPKIGTAPGTAGAAGYLLGGTPLPPGNVAMQMPITFTLGGQTLPITTAENVAKAHRDGLAWQTWMSGNAQDGVSTWRRLVGQCVDGIMTARPVAFERMLVKDKIKGPGRKGTDPCAKRR
jgi:glycerophosphoryl diester phosphodiesterase